MSLFHIGSELRRFGHGKLPRLAIVVVACLPLIFGGLFVWAYYDPIGNLKNLPVALVNSDAGAEYPDGTPLQAGDTIVQALHENGVVDFKDVDAEEARIGVGEGTYYFAMEIPTDFSESAVSVQSEQPHSAKINVLFNNRNGLIPTTVGNMVTREIITVIDGQLGAEVASQLLMGYTTIGEGMNEAADGSQQLADGSAEAEDGAEQLYDGALELRDGMVEADDGVGQLQDGAEQLDDGLAEAKDGSDQLSDGLAQLKAATDLLGDGAQQVSDGVDQVAELADSVANIQEQVLAPLVNVSTQLRSLGFTQLANVADAAITQLRSYGLDGEVLGQIGLLQDGARTISTELLSPVAQYRSGMDQAAEGSQELADGLAQLKDGSGQLLVGVNQLADGTSQLVDGSNQLVVGMAQLRDGTVQLADGSTELTLAISEGAEEVPRWEGDRLTEASDAVSQAVQREMIGQNFTKFGIGLAPFFISLALFVGATTMFMLLRPIQRRALDSGVDPFRAMLASYFPAMLVGLTQAVLIWVVQHFLIGFEAFHPWRLLLAMMGVSMVFVAITQAINTVVGATAGRVICLMLMALQLVSSGGLYPLETQPQFLQKIHAWDPMTYSVDLFRSCIVEGIGVPDYRGYQGIFVLILVGIIAWAVSTVGAWWGRVVPAKDLHPEVSV